MKFAAGSLAIIGITSAVALYASLGVPNSGSFLGRSSDESAFLSYLNKYGKSYATKEEYQFRLA